MNKYTKLGVTALAGSLASLAAAEAGTYSVSGGVTLSHTGQKGDGVGTYDVTGNPLGMSRNMTLNASGELDNGYSWSYYAATNDLVDGGFNMTSAGFSMNMDTLGTVRLSQKASPLGAIDDITPNAYEEAWDGLTGAASVNLVGGIGGGAATHVSWTSAMDLPMGSEISLAYAPGEVGGNATADKGSSSTAATRVKGSGYEVVLKMAPAEGLTVGAGYAVTDTQGGLYEGDGKEGTWYATYKTGGVTIHYQRSYETDGISSTAAATSPEYYDTDAYGVSFAVNDQLSVSLTQVNNQRVLNDTGLDTSQEFTGVGAAYNIGGATLKLSHNQVDNRSWNTTTDDERTVIALGMAF